MGAATKRVRRQLNPVGVLRTPPARTRLIGQSVEFIEDLRNQQLAAWVLRLGGDSKKLDQISRLCGGLGLSRRWCSDGMALEFVLAPPQGSLIGLDLEEAPTQFG